MLYHTILYAALYNTAPFFWLGLLIGPSFACAGQKVSNIMFTQT